MSHHLECLSHILMFLLVIFQIHCIDGIPNRCRLTNNTRICIVQNLPGGTDIWGIDDGQTSSTYCMLHYFESNRSNCQTRADLVHFRMNSIKSSRLKETMQNMSNISDHRQQIFFGRKRSKNVLSSTSQWKLQQNSMKSNVIDVVMVVLML